MRKESAFWRLLSIKARHHIILWRGSRRTMKASSLMISMLAVMAMSSPKDNHECSSSSSTPSSPFDHLMHSEPQCQRTQIFPFVTGCPEHCRRAVDDKEPMYRMTLEWYFGQSDQYPLKDGKRIAYPRGINFQCPDQFVSTFQSAATSLYTSLQESLPNQTGSLLIKKQKQMHLSLSYFCCLRQNETHWIREAMYQWIQERSPFSFNIAFEENAIQCWHEGPNSVTFIILVDNQTQQLLLDMNHDLNRYLESMGVPIVVQREQQMPFHVTLQGVRYGKDYSTLPQFNITDSLPTIYNITTKLSRTHNKTTNDNYTWSWSNICVPVALATCQHGTPK
jgi:hypothetical protein